ncbi:MAG: hypothetical protein ACFUZC_19715 [Chthoniobacteraceae bacterium]
MRKNYYVIKGSPVSHIICVPCFEREMKQEKISKPRFYPPNMQHRPPGSSDS